ncbi:unnamed protein product, partial [Symbiodinium natans]
SRSSIRMGPTAHHLFSQQALTACCWDHHCVAKVSEEGIHQSLQPNPLQFFRRPQRAWSEAAVSRYGRDNLDLTVIGGNQLGQLVFKGKDESEVCLSSEFCLSMWLPELVCQKQLPSASERFIRFILLAHLGFRMMEEDTNKYAQAVVDSPSSSSTEYSDDGHHSAERRAASESSESLETSARREKAEVVPGSAWACCCSDVERGSKQLISATLRRPSSSAQHSLRSSMRSASSGSFDAAPLQKEKEDPFLQMPAAPGPTPASPSADAPPTELPEATPASTRSQTLDRRLAKLRAAVALHRPSKEAVVPAADDSDTKSESAYSARSDFSVQTAVVAQHSQAQPQDAAGLKAALKTFIQEFVRGRELHMPSKAGLKGVVCKITKAVDALLVGDGARAVALVDIQQVHRGLEALPLNLGIEPDGNWVVLELKGGDCLSFHLGHAKGAEDFALFMRLLVSMRRQQQLAANTQEDDDAKSEVSVQSAIVQKTMNSSSVASIADDPKEVKKMYKMFVETMKRGRDFYILRPDGTLLDVDCSLTRGREVFRMRWDFQERSLPVADMKQVRTSKESSSLKLGLELDPRCATMELEGGECITFKFGHSEACDRFVICMRILIDQKRQCFRSSGFGGATAQQKSSSSGRPSSDSTIGGGPNATQALIEDFVRVMMSSCEVLVLNAQGKQKVKLSLDADLTALSVKAKDGSRKDLLFSQVKAVHVGQAAEALQLGARMDDLCAVLELSSGDCLTLRFPKTEDRDRFAICIRIFAAAHQATWHILPSNFTCGILEWPFWSAVIKAARHADPLPAVCEGRDRHDAGLAGMKPYLRSLRRLDSCRLPCFRSLRLAFHDPRAGNNPVAVGHADPLPAVREGQDRQELFVPLSFAAVGGEVSADSEFPDLGGIYLS